MDNRPYKELTVFLFLLSFGKTYSGSIFGLNLGSLRDAAVNNIEQVPKFLHRVHLFNRHQQHSEEKNPTAFQDNREMVENARISFPYANTLNPAKYEDQQNWGVNNPASFSINQDNSGYNGYKTTISPSPNKYLQRQESFSDSPILFTDNVGSTDYNGYKNTFNPKTNKQLQGYSFAPMTSHFNNKVISGNNLNYADRQVNVNNRGSFYNGVENSKPLLSENDKKKNPADEYLSEHADEFNMDFSTTTDNEWTTTDEPLNRIGAPPAVVASILG